MRVQVTKADSEGVLASLGVRTSYTKDEEWEARMRARPAAKVAEVERIRRLYSVAKLKKMSRYHDPDKAKLERLEDQIRAQEQMNQASSSQRIVKALKVVFKTLPKGSEVEIEFDWFKRYPFVIHWKPKGSYAFTGRMGLYYEQEWLENEKSPEA